MFDNAVKGQDYFIVTLFGDFDSQPMLEILPVLTHYPIYSEGDGYLIFDLNQPKELRSIMPDSRSPPGLHHHAFL